MTVREQLLDKLGEMRVLLLQATSDGVDLVDVEEVAEDIGAAMFTLEQTIGNNID